MPLALIIIGLVLLLSGVRDTYADLGSTIVGEFKSDGRSGCAYGFGCRAGAILMIGVLGYAGDNWRKLSVGLLVLWTVALIVSKDSGVFTNLQKAWAQGPVAPKVTKVSAPAAQAPAQAPAQSQAPAQGATKSSSSGESALDEGTDYLGMAMKYLPYVLMLL